MEARMGTDERILDILERDSQKGIVLLMEKYTALVWHICSRYVKDPEDIKEFRKSTGIMTEKKLYSFSNIRNITK